MIKHALAALVVTSQDDTWQDRTHIPAKDTLSTCDQQDSVMNPTFGS